MLGTHCITLRNTTERPVTLREHGGVSELVGNDPELIKRLLAEFSKTQRLAHRPAMWDGKTSHRIVAEIVGAKTKYTAASQVGT